MLHVEHLTVQFYSGDSIRTIVRDVGFHVPSGKITAIVGESGSGKTITTIALTGIAYQPPGIVSGKISFNGRCIFAVPGNGNGNPAMSFPRAVRGRKIAYIAQEPRLALDPLFTIGDMIKEQLILSGTPKKTAEKEIPLLLQRVGLDPERIRNAHSYALSGGMCQLATLAVALASKPELLIADEPTTFLDARFQEAVLALLKHLNRTEHLTIILVTHSMKIVRKLADHVIVMYSGEVLETISNAELFSNGTSVHPYTSLLLSEDNPGIHRKIPSTCSCVFADRCPDYQEKICCNTAPVKRIRTSRTHSVRCLRYK